VARPDGLGAGRLYTHEWVERLLFITYGDGHSRRGYIPSGESSMSATASRTRCLNTVPVVLVDWPHALWAGERLVLEPPSVQSRR
jgi:hypothetical protein